MLPSTHATFLDTPPTSLPAALSLFKLFCDDWFRLFDSIVPFPKDGPYTAHREEFTSCIDSILELLSVSHPLGGAVYGLSMRVLMLANWTFTYIEEDMYRAFRFVDDAELVPFEAPPSPTIFQGVPYEFLIAAAFHLNH